MRSGHAGKCAVLVNVPVSMQNKSPKTKYELSFAVHPPFQTLLNEVDGLPTDVSLNGVKYTLETNSVTVTEASWNAMRSRNDVLELEVSTS